jgi:predicted TIM-barrel fold metal-dependent hydrolase
MIIDCDTHILPRDSYDHIDGPLAALAPKFTVDSAGFVNGTVFPGAPPAVPGATPLPSPGSGCRYPGMYPGPERARFFADQGIDRELVLPQFSAMLFSYLVDAPLATAMAHSYNVSILNAMRAEPERIIGAALVALQDVDGAIAEIEWAHENGFKAIAIDKVFPVRAHPYSETLGSHRELWPFFERAAQLRMPLMMHSIQHGHRLSNLMYFQSDGLELFAPTEGHLSLVSLVTSGLLDDYPDLRFVYTEAGTAFIRPLVQKLDAALEKPPVNYDDEDASARFHRRIAPGTERSSAGKRLTSTEIYEVKNRRPASHYFRNNLFFTIETEEPEFADAVEFLGASQFLFATDYPHDDPGGRMKMKDVELLREHPRLTERAKQMIRSENALALLG